MDEGIRYEFHVAAPLSPTAAAAFPELTIARSSNGTVLFGTVRDDAELYGLLDRFFVMGLSVTTMHRLPD